MSPLETRIKTQEVMAEFRCMDCRQPTAGATLAAYGVRCRRCFDAYCNAPQPPQKLWLGRKPGDVRTFDLPEAP